MKKVSILFVFASLVVLIGCAEAGITIGSDTINNPGKTITAVGSDSTVLSNGTINSTNTEDYYRINLPNSLSGDVIYLELGGSNLKLTVYDANKTAVRESNSADFFGVIGSGLKPTSLETEAIGVDLSCRGPCVIINAASGVVYAKVEARSAAPANYDFYVYSDNYQDSTDPENNPTQQGGQFFCGNIKVEAIVPIPTDESYIGAIETVEDVDCFETENKVKGVNIETFPATTINVTAYIYQGNQLLGTITAPPKGTATKSLIPSAITPVPNEKIVAIVVGGNPNNNIRRAAVSGNSKYKLTFE